MAGRSCQGAQLNKKCFFPFSARREGEGDDGLTESVIRIEGRRIFFGSFFYDDVGVFGKSEVSTFFRG